MLHLLTDTLRNSVLITGIVIIMMMMIESFNIESHGRLFSKVKGSSLRQVILASVLGSIPGCIGGFATVSLYSRRLLSFGALTAMMIASSGDEAFVMLAMMPDRALWIFAILFAVAVFSGVAIDRITKTCHPEQSANCHPEQSVNCHPERSEGSAEDANPDSSLPLRMTSQPLRMTSPQTGMTAQPPGMTAPQTGMTTQPPGMTAPQTEMTAKGKEGPMAEKDGTKPEPERQTDPAEKPAGQDTERRSLTWRRIVLTAVIILFAVALAAGWMEHDHAVPETGKIRLDLLSEWWMNLIFAILCIIMLIILCFRSDRFIKETLWHHVLRKHLPNIFAWTFGVLLLIGILSEYIDLGRWVSDNTALMILLAVAVGIIPESGPHLIFVTMYASGLVPLPVLLASSISQDGHSSLPLLADDKRSFVYAKLLNCIIALIVGFGTLLLF